MKDWRRDVWPASEYIHAIRGQIGQHVTCPILQQILLIWHCITYISRERWSSSIALLGSSGTLASIGARAAGIPYFPASMSLVRHCVRFLCSLRNCIGHNLNCCLCPQCCDTHKFKVQKGWLWAFCQERRGWGAKSGARQVPRHIFEPGFLELSCTVKLGCHSHIIIYIYPFAWFGARSSL